SSARVALIEFRRACEQYQKNTIIHQFCEPVMRRFLKESVLNGTLELPDDYFTDPTPYEVVNWVAPAWDYVNPLQEVQAALAAVRAGFKSRAQVIRELGFDPEIVDAQSATER